MRLCVTDNQPQTREQGSESKHKVQAAAVSTNVLLGHDSTVQLHNFKALIYYNIGYITSAVEKTKQ
jgi:hypothetical protein